MKDYSVKKYLLQLESSNNSTWEIYPKVGLEKIKFNMTMDQVKKIIPAPCKTFMKTPHSKFPTIACDSLGVYVFFENTGTCRMIEVYEGKTTVNVVYKGYSFFKHSINDAYKFLKNIDSKTTLEEDDGQIDVYSEKLGIQLVSGINNKNIEIVSLMLNKR